MSRNGSGIYSLPGTYQAVSGETIEAQQHNDPLEDLQSDANAARPVVAGGTGATTAAAARTNLAAPGTGTTNTFTKTQTWSKGADVASANALTLGDDGNYFDITGTTAITSIATKDAGTVVKLHFDGALTLTHDATALVLPAGVNITTAAGDEAEFVEYATGDWRCTSYQRATGDPLRAGPMPAAFKKLSIKTASNTTVTVTADFVTTTDGTSFQTTAVSSTINFATTGVDALDTGTIAADTWYAIWVIAKADGTTKCLASTSATSPTMPSGYTFKARVGWVPTVHASAILYGVWQLGRRVAYIQGLAGTTADLMLIAQGVAGTYSPTSPTLSSVTVVGNGKLAPTTASRITVVATTIFKGGTTAGVLVAPSTSWGGSNRGPSGTAGFPWPIFTASAVSSASAEIFLEATTIAWASDAAGGGIYCLGWEDNI